MANPRGASSESRVVTVKREEIPGILRDRTPLSNIVVDGSNLNGPLRYAIVTGDTALVKQILAKGIMVGVNAVGQDNLSHLHMACSDIIDEDDACVIAKALIENGAHTELRTKDVNWKGGSGGDAPGGGSGVKAGVVQMYETGGRTCLHLAAERGLVKLTRLLLDQGAEVFVWDNDGDTPLSLFSRSKRVQRIMSEKKGETNTNDNHQETCPRASITVLMERLKGGDNNSSEKKEAVSESRARQMRMRARITRAAKRDARAMRLETIGIIRREFDWRGVNVLDEEKVFDPRFLSAYNTDHQKPPHERSKLQKLLYRPAPKHPKLAVWAFTMLSRTYCDSLMEALGRFEAFKKARGLKIRRSGSRYGALFNHVGFQEVPACPR
mmetsp:Transcript_14146/g.23091  ORF Transcript_14146/g.23091 Transcript_14146/m.23091 type:complete len:382 (+) Transcript_14146:39-1184(+)